MAGQEYRSHTHIAPPFIMIKNKGGTWDSGPDPLSLFACHIWDIGPAPLFRLLFSVSQKACHVNV